MLSQIRIVLYFQQRNQLLYCFNFLKVASHIGSQDEARHALSEVDKLESTQIMKEIMLLISENLEQLRSVVVLLDRQIVAIDCTVSYRVDVKFILEAIMTQIVASCGDDQTELIESVHDAGVNQLPLCHEEEGHLHHIGSVEVIVIWNDLMVRSLNLGKEVSELLVVDFVN